MSDQNSSQVEGSSYSFVRFARQPFYRAVNEHLVEISEFKPGGAILDLACGTGEITKLILNKLHGVKNTIIIAMDASTKALDQAKKELADAKGVMIQFVQGQAEQLSQTLKGRVDAVVFCNAIHMVDDKHKVLGEIHKVLNPGGILAFNSTFFDGCQLPETETFYRRWMLKALRLLKRKHGLLPSRDVKVASRRQLTPEEYEQLLNQEGFIIKERKLEPVKVTLEGWLGISEFSDFIQGAMPGVPLAAASEALQEAVTQVFQELELEAVPRLWLHVVAARPQTT
jgi:ubiquinone/menaquinone biosynthesis C-methylase UbiE